MRCVRTTLYVFVGCVATVILLCEYSVAFSYYLVEVPSLSCDFRVVHIVLIITVFI